MIAVDIVPSAAQSWDDVVAAAEKEGTVVWYTNQRAQGIEPLLQKFREAYPKIQTEAVRITSNAMMERFVTEYNAGRHLADVVITFSDDRLIDGLKEDWMAEWSPPELPNFPPEYNQENKLFTLSHAREAIVWNKNLVAEDDAPKEWSDLFDPKWKGKVGLNPVWRAIPVLQVVAYWEDRLKLGDTAQKLKANDVFFFEGSGGVIQALIRGDIQVAEITDSTLNPLLEDGAPFGVHYPASGTTTSASVSFVAKNAPHPNAARVFMNWLMTEEGQLHMQNDLALPVTRNGMPSLSHLPATKDLPNVTPGPEVLTPERRAQIVENWQRVFGIR
ncbi:ABC transporter substrate-binding protein [Pseudochelatococcus sp. B33]